MVHEGERADLEFHYLPDTLARLAHYHCDVNIFNDCALAVSLVAGVSHQ